MAIPPGLTITDYLNQQINTLVTFREWYTVYGTDWLSLPQSVQAALQAKANTMLTGVQSALTDVNNAIQGLKPNIQPSGTTKANPA